MLLACQWLGDARAIGTDAGTSIVNTANATYDVAGLPGSPVSAVDSFLVDEILDVAVVADDATYVNATSPGTNAALAFTVTNTGNGPEPYRLVVDGSLAGDNFDPQNLRIYLDNGDGVFGAGTDTLYVLDGNNPLLVADASRRVFVVADTPAALAAGAIGLVQLTATAQTGSGAPGTVFAGAGENGVDAVAGSSTASDDAQNGYLVAQVTTTLVKSQAVDDHAGGSLPASGSTITYTLTFTVSGVGSIGDVLVADTIPADTTYVPGSMTLNGLPLTDATGDDEGRFTGTRIEVRPGGGTLVAPTVQVITFDTDIN